MKKLLLKIFSLALMLSISNRVHTQCMPDPQYANEVFGIFPIPDPTSSTVSSLPAACLGEPYNQLFTVILPDSLGVELVVGTPIVLDLQSLTITNITGLPPGINYVCNPNDCIFPDQTSGCFTLEGTPTTEGEYLFVVETILDIGGTTAGTNFPGAFYSGQYKIIVEPEGSTACSPMGTNDRSEDTFELGQNIPNPFSTIANIEIDATEAGEFDFKVYNSIGQVISAQNLNLMVGINPIQLDATNLNSGVYFYTLGQGANIVTKKMFVNK